MLRVSTALWGEDLKKLGLLAEAVGREAGEGDKRLKALVEEEEAVKIVVDELREGVGGRRREVERKLEYEESCRLVNEAPSLKETRAEITGVENKMAKLSEGAGAADELIELKEKQFQLLLQVISDLKQNLGEGK